MIFIRNTEKNQIEELILLLIIILFLVVYWIQAINSSLTVLIFPIMVSLILIVLSIIQIPKVLQLLKRSKKKRLYFNKSSFGKLGVILVLIISIYFWDILGTFLTITFFTAVTMYILNERRLKVILPFAIAFAFLVWFVFQNFLSVPLPSGVLF